MDPEAEVHAINTNAWIQSGPISLSLTREVDAPDGAGGTTKATVAKLAQTFRLDKSGNQSISQITSPIGTQVPEKFRLVGDVNADVEEGDTFIYDGLRFRVTHVNLSTFQRVSAEVEYLG